MHLGTRVCVCVCVCVCLRRGMHVLMQECACTDNGGCVYCYKAVNVSVQVSACECALHLKVVS